MPIRSHIRTHRALATASGPPRHVRVSEELHGLRHQLARTVFRWTLRIGLPCSCSLSTFDIASATVSYGITTFLVTGFCSFRKSVLYTGMNE